MNTERLIVLLKLLLILKESLDLCDYFHASRVFANYTVDLVVLGAMKKEIRSHVNSILTCYPRDQYLLFNITFLLFEKSRWRLQALWPYESLNQFLRHI